jgi:hypothetical protein
VGAERSLRKSLQDAEQYPGICKLQAICAVPSS